MTGEFPAQRASDAENVSIWCRHHGFRYFSRKQAVPWWCTLNGLHILSLMTKRDLMHSTKKCYINTFVTAFSCNWWALNISPVHIASTKSCCWLVAGYKHYVLFSNCTGVYPILYCDTSPVYPVDSLQFVWDIDFVASASHWAPEGVSPRMVRSWNLLERCLFFVDVSVIPEYVLQVCVRN